MRASVQQLDLPHLGNDAGVITLSAGVATLDPDTTRSAREVLKEADDALYQAKQRGRNRVEIVNTDITDAPAVLRIVTESPTVGV
jgi:diguanylate cyclase (GGDEF)-like protein